MAHPRLEVFETATGNDVIITTPRELEEMRLTAYEKGYGAGWEDAADALQKEQAHIRADLAHHLRMLEFTFHEAKAHLLKSIYPLISTIILQILPKISHESLAPLIGEVLKPQVEQLANTPITLVINPAIRPVIETFLQQITSLPIAFIDEPSLSEGQAYLRLGPNETHINIDRAVLHITEAVQNFFQVTLKDAQS